MNVFAQPARRFLVALALLTLLGAGSTSARALSPIEERLLEYVDAHNDEALAFLERVVNINSGTMNFEGVREVGALFRAELDAIGFETEWVDGEPFGRAGHLVARWRGKGPHLLLIGHLDTVFELDSPFQRFEPLPGNRAKGPGTTDMKGGNIILIQALAALRSVGLLDRLSVTVVLTGDEEKVGDPVPLARKALTDAAREADYALGFEDGDGDSRTAVIARRGSTTWELTVTGKSAHSSQIFREDIGSGAIYETARILAGFHEALSGEPNLTFNPGVILGGTSLEFDASQGRGSAFGKDNVIAERTIVVGDLRTLSLEQLEETKSRMREIVAEHLPHTGAEISFRDRYPPLAPSEGNLALLAKLNTVSSDLGFGPVTAVDPRRAGAADVSFTAGLVEGAIDGLGLFGKGGHTERETADLDTLPMQTKRIAVLFARLALGQ